MQLLPDDLKATLPALYSQEDEHDPLVPVRFYTPDSNWSWYPYEGSLVDSDGYYDTDAPKTDFLFFGLVDGFEAELGYFSLNELTRVSGPLGMPIARDLRWTPRRLSEVRAEIGR